MVKCKQIREVVILGKKKQTLNMLIVTKCAITYKEQIENYHGGL
jgi:hypothetical protein